MKHSSIAGLVCALLLSSVMSVSAASEDADKSNLFIHFNTSKNTMYFHEAGWFKSTDYPVRYFNGLWRWQGADGTWHALLTPFIGKWNKNYRLILNSGGRIIVSKKDNSDNFEIKLINGGWHYRVDVDWIPLDDMFEQ